MLIKTLWKMLTNDKLVTWTLECLFKQSMAGTQELSFQRSRADNY